MPTVERDIWNDPDLLDFEDPTKRAILAAKMGNGPMPASVSTARMIMFLQPALPIMAPIGLLVFRVATGANQQQAETAPTTTTTVVDAAQQGQQQGGGAGVFLLGFVGFIVLVVGVVTCGMRLKRMTPGARGAAIGVEAALALMSVALLTRGLNPITLTIGLSLAGTAIGVIALLLSSSAKAAVAQAGVSDTSTRFDIRNLQGLDR